MAPRDELGSFELTVLTAVLHLDGESYGMEVRREIEARTGRSVSIGAVYATLDRLEQKKLLCSSWAPPTAERGGRSRRMYRIEAAGQRALAHTRQALQDLLRGMAPLPRRS
jgi:PadR family transcriptional regulator, regulatory protein PadR